MGTVSSEPIQNQQLPSNTSKCSNDDKRRKFPRWNNIRKRLSRGKGMFRTHDHGKMLRDLAQTWSYQEVVALVDHYEALLSLKDSITQKNLNRDHGEPLKSDMLDLLHKGLCTDVTLVFNGIKFPAHRAILSSRCTYFQELFSDLDFKSMSEVPVNIPVEGISVDMFSTLLQYLYTGDFASHTSGFDSLDMLMQLGEEFGTPNVLEQDLKGLLYNAEHADMVLVFEGHQYPDIVKDNTTLSETRFEVPCHKAILCARSPFFRSLILNKQLDLPVSGDCIHLVLDERVFPQQYARVVLQCMYTDSFDLSSVVKWGSEERKGYGIGSHNLLTMAEIAMEVYEVAKFIEFDVLTQGCEDILQEELSPSSILGILDWSCQPHGSDWVAKQAEQYLLEEFTTVAQTETFNKLPKKYLVKLLQSDFLQACEHDILLAVMRWGEAQAAKKMIQTRQDLIQDGKRSAKRRRAINKAVKKELCGVINHVRIQHVLPLHSELVDSAMSRGLIDRGMPLDIGQGSFYPSCPWMRRRNDKDFVKPRLFLHYYDEAKRIFQDYRDTEMQVVQQRMLRLGQSIPDTLYMFSGTLEKTSRSRDNSRSVADLGSPENLLLYCRKKRSNSLSQAERLFARSRGSLDFGLPDVASSEMYHDESFEVQSSPAIAHLHQSYLTMPTRRPQVCSTISLPLATTPIPDVASSTSSTQSVPGVT